MHISGLWLVTVVCLVQKNRCFLFSSTAVLQIESSRKCVVYMSCLDSAAHQTYMFPTPFLEISVHAFKHVGTDFSRT